jgi:hypothetical protein
MKAVGLAVLLVAASADACDDFVLQYNITRNCHVVITSVNGKPATQADADDWVGFLERSQAPRTTTISVEDAVTLFCERAYDGSINSAYKRGTHFNEEDKKWLPGLPTYLKVESGLLPSVERHEAKVTSCD